MLGLRMPELLLILAVIVLLFGGSKLPALGAGMGQALRSFKDAMKGDGEGDGAAAGAAPAAKAPAASPPGV